jgi:hypothetical protein
MNRNSVQEECENKSDTGNKWGNWNHFKKSLRKYLSNTPGKHKIKELQKKQPYWGTAHILWNVLLQKYKTYFTGEITLHVVQIVNAEQLQHCIP